jgi:hypothetical protein
MDKTLSRLISRIERLEANLDLSSRQFPDWVRTRCGAMLVLRTLAAMRWLALRQSALTHVVQARIMAKVVATDCIESANELAGELLAPWRDSDVTTTPNTTEETS